MSETVFHDDAVEDIARTVNTPNFFDGTADHDKLANRGYAIIDSLDNLERFRDSDWPDAEIEFPMNWTDILGDTIIPLLAAKRYLSEEDRNRFSSKMESAFAQCKASLEEKAARVLGFQQHGPDLVAFVYEVIHVRAGCGILMNSLLEELWEIIVLGGYPCGWSGGKDGRLVVFVPK